MRALMAVRLVAVLCTGLVAGILLGDRMGASFARPMLSPAGFVQFQQVVHVHFVRMMPMLIGSAILAGLIWLVMSRARLRDAEVWLVAGATGAVIAILVLTRAVNVPINEQLMGWNVASPPTNVIELWAPWERAHTVRTVLAVVAFLLHLIALGLASSPATAGRVEVVETRSQSREKSKPGARS